MTADQLAYARADLRRRTHQSAWTRGRIAHGRG
jgi:hypothetical protein